MGLPRPFTDERAQGQAVLGLGERERDVLLAWVGENLTLVRRSAFGQRILYWSLGIGFVVGLAAQWYRKTADAGNTRAMFSLGALLAEQGEEDQAEQWYRKAADAGHRDG